MLRLAEQRGEMAAKPTKRVRRTDGLCGAVREAVGEKGWTVEGVCRGGERCAREQILKQAPRENFRES